MAGNYAERLRQLVGDYYHGLITPESYRQQRAELLDNLGGYEDTEPITRTQPRPTPAPGDAPPSVARPQSSATWKTKWLIPGGIAVVIVVVVTAFLVLRSPETANDLPPPDSSAESTQTDAGRGHALLQEFLDRNDWSDDSLANFLIAWGALSEDDRDAAAGGRIHRRLGSNLHQRIREETALGSAAGASALQSLTDFAVELGVPYRDSRAAIPDPDSGADDATAPVLQTGIDDPVASAVSGESPSESESSVAATGQAEMEPVAEVEADTVPPEPEPEPEPEPDVAKTELAVEQQMEPSPVAASAPPIDDPCSADLARSRRPYCQDTLLSGSDGPPLVVLPAGSFEMGSNINDQESPVHQVHIANAIAMSRYEITAAEFAQFCSASGDGCPEFPSGVSDHPVVLVSWDEAARYAVWLTEQTGFQYRLPSEAEWEYAARGGTQTPYPFGDEVTPSAAHSSVNGDVAAPLPRSDRSINRNGYRLYHMSGNVREWVQDVWYPDHNGAPQDGSARLQGFKDVRVVRGGSYNDAATKLRSASREPLDRSHRDPETGIRIVREISRQIIDK